MRVTVAKKIRKSVYGDNSIHVREYRSINATGTRMNTGLRLAYQEVKSYFILNKKLPTGN